MVIELAELLKDKEFKGEIAAFEEHLWFFVINAEEGLDSVLEIKW
jgi:hypothetical protein